jgi:translation initiation factor IF-3
VTATNEPRINERIRAREVRLVDPDGLQLGIKPLPDALQLARDLDLDLVEVAPQANPPVCRIMDYGKFKFDAAQRAKESRRKTNNVSLKEMKYRPKIGPGDFETKTRQVARFLGEGHKVKVTIMFRGREVFHPELGKKILDRVAEEVDGTAKVEVAPRLDGRNMVMVLAPDRRARPVVPAGKGQPGEVTGIPVDGVADGDAPARAAEGAPVGAAAAQRQVPPPPRPAGQAVVSQAASPSVRAESP